MFYEYMFLITFVQIIVYKLNDEISKGIIPIGKLFTMYTSTLDSLNAINRSIVGAPVLINIIMGYLSSIIYMLYHYVLFKGMFVKVDVHRFFPILDVLMRLFDIAMLYYLCQTTEKEVRRTTLILNRLSITANPTLRRKIAFFSLRRLHANFHFELCGFYKINL
ncbi:uncharacterized protein LOC111041506, partial [Myzus persicae]|uniref:uncharacterized protein LOC111041506 n=1 Tax=Myzus persicae TaxID=13164 RepID=UPI000B9338A6